MLLNGRFALQVGLALSLYQALKLMTFCGSPVVFVTSGSMEPTLHRGDLLVVSNYDSSPYRAGDIVVFYAGQWKDGMTVGEGRMVVHRVIRVHETRHGKVKMMTKGDNNKVDDSELYKESGFRMLSAARVVGRVEAYVPYVGLVTVLPREHPLLVQGLTVVVAVLMLRDMII